MIKIGQKFYAGKNIAYEQTCLKGEATVYEFDTYKGEFGWCVSDPNELVGKKFIVKSIFRRNDPNTGYLIYYPELDMTDIAMKEHILECNMCIPYNEIWDKLNV